MSPTVRHQCRSGTADLARLRCHSAVLTDSHVDLGTRPPDSHSTIHRLAGAGGTAKRGGAMTSLSDVDVDTYASNLVVDTANALVSGGSRQQEVGLVPRPCGSSNAIDWLVGRT